MTNATYARFAAAMLLIQSLLMPVAVTAQDVKQAAEPEIFTAIRKEGMEKSKIMNTLHVFTDLYGPRLTGSPNMTNAAKWTANEMKSWGFDKAEIEPWNFGRPGWVNERNTGLMLSPVADTLTYEVLAWTPSTKGVVTSEAVHMVTPRFPAPTNPQVMQNPTLEELNAYLESVRSAVRGKIVLVGEAARPQVNINPPAKRTPDETIKRQFDPATPQQQGPFGGGGPQNQTPPRPNALPTARVNEIVTQFLVDNKVQLRINDAGREHGQIRAFGAFSYDNHPVWDGAKVPPTVVMRNEDFGRITRLLKSKHAVKLEFDIRNRWIPEGATSYNVVGEIWGSDKKDEVIMLGGHLDSWHSATGATDNAIGCATMMEAARILKAIGAKMRRTVRVACWSGEEQGLLGSEAYVAKHFGTVEKPGPDFGKFGGYFNIDSGTGRARGMSIFGPPEAATVLRDALKPFEDYGFFGARATRSRATGGSDHTSFNWAGLPGIGVQQDPIEYNSTTWHTNLDTYERIIEDDVKKSAIIVAAGVYTLANRDELLPRFTPETMPTPVPPPTPSPSPTPGAAVRP
jgi:carboxypeptidase Q